MPTCVSESIDIQTSAPAVPIIVIGLLNDMPLQGLTTNKRGRE